jgi:hypothetical protein
MAWTEWQGRCEACSALCCTWLAFDKGADFGHDKPAGQPCRHLAGHRCAIHDDLSAYPGCKRYDCGGAGQRAVALGADFAATRRLHDDHLTLSAAAALPLPPEAEAQRRALLAALAAEEDLTAPAIAAYAQGPLPGEVRLFLRGLRALLPHR